MLRYLLVYRTPRSRLQRRLAAISDEYYTWIGFLFAFLVALTAYTIYKYFTGDYINNDYLDTEYAHHIIV